MMDIDIAAAAPAPAEEEGEAAVVAAAAAVVVVVVVHRILRFTLYVIEVKQFKKPSCVNSLKTMLLLIQ